MNTQALYKVIRSIAQDCYSNDKELAVLHEQALNELFYPEQKVLTEEQALKNIIRDLLIIAEGLQRPLGERGTIKLVEHYFTHAIVDTKHFRYQHLLK